MGQVWRWLQQHALLGVSLSTWVAFLTLTAALFLCLRVLVGVVRRRLVARAGRTGLAYDAYLARLIERTWASTLLAVSAFVAVRFLGLWPPGTAQTSQIERAIRALVLLAVFLQVGRWGTSLIDTALHEGLRLARFPESTARTAIEVVRFFALSALWISIAILILGTFGIEITPLLAGLGVGGIAVGFALQRILGDIFCSVAIVLDRPFEVGDFIHAGDEIGTVERIGIKTTRLRSLGGEQVVFPNADLIQSRIHNFRLMTERRVVFRFNLAPVTAVGTLERVPQVVRTLIETVDRARFDRAHFATIGDAAFTFEVVYFVLDPNPGVAMDVQQQINLALLRVLAEIGAPLAQPRPVTAPAVSVAEPASQPTPRAPR
jgi:small-conductance mechanosensitive channel